MDVVQLVLLRLVLRTGAAFHFFHGPAIYAYLLDRLGNPPRFPRGCGFLAIESGRVSYLPGEAYHLALTLRPDAEVDLDAWLRALGGPPRGKFGRMPNAPFGAGTVLDDVVDCVADRRLQRGWRARFLDVADLDEPVDLLVRRDSVTVRFDTPLLILRTPVARKDTLLDGDVFDPVAFLQRTAETVGEVFPRLAPLSPLPRVELLRNRLVRTDAPYPRKVLLGSRGSVTLGLPDGVDRAWARTLIVAGLLGAGKATQMGQGRFSIVEAPALPTWPPSPARTLCERAASPHVLDRARDALARGGRLAGVDGVDRDAFLESLSYRLGSLQDRLASGEARAAPLRGVLLEKGDGRIRGLAVPTMADRFLQRAVFEELAPAVDQLLEDSSFAFRRGLSRRNAEHSLRIAHDEGYRHVLDADVRAFFDVVDWDVLETALRAYLGSDPVVEMLLAWVKAPVEFAGRRIDRSAGLPQGAVVSPLLANLYLDPFDEAIRARGFRMVRYADDFVVLCRTADDVARARQAVEEELAKLRIALASEKTRATTFESGFHFLGFLFCRSIVLESPAARPRFCRSDEDVDFLDAVELLPSEATGWIADGLKQVGASAEAQVDDRWHSPVVKPSGAQRPVYVVSPGLRLTGTRRGLRILEGDAIRSEIAWARISEIAVLGGRPLSASVFQHALRHRVPVSLYKRSGEPLGLLLPERVRSPSPTAHAHSRWLESPSARIAAARSLIEAKIHNARLLARHQSDDEDRLRDHLAQLGAAALRAESLEKLRGIEGQAAHAWFSGWPRWLAPRFEFPGRFARGATDPVNVVLNLLYTQLFRLCWMAAIAEGLDPYLGVLHEGRGRYAALAADLQEPFRFLCDRLALEMVRRGQLDRSDFSYDEKRDTPLRMRSEALRRVLAAWERRLDVVVGAVSETASYREHVFRQAARFAELVRGERAEMLAFRLKW